MSHGVPVALSLLDPLAGRGPRLGKDVVSALCT
jgi:hypothetical protein